MKKVAVIIMISSLFGLLLAGPAKDFKAGQKAKVKAQVEQQKCENKEMRESLKGKTPEEKKTAWKEHKAKQKAENKKFRDQIHQENMVFVKEKLAKNKKLTDAQKEELLDKFESKYQERVKMRDKKQKEKVAKFEKIANDDKLTQEQKKAAIDEQIETTGEKAEVE